MKYAKITLLIIVLAILANARVNTGYTYKSIAWDFGGIGYAPKVEIFLCPGPNPLVVLFPWLVVDC